MRNGFRFYTVADLKMIPPGTVFWHQSLGKCIVLKDCETKWRRMVFKDPKVDDVYFINDDYPWTIPMKLVHSGLVGW